jgi:hypothetical protein
MRGSKQCLGWLLRLRACALVWQIVYISALIVVAVHFASHPLR